MTEQHGLKRLVLLSSVLAWTGCCTGIVLSSTILGSVARADTLRSSASIPSTTVAVTFTPPRGDAPQDTRGGASRSNSCTTATNDSQSFMLLTPTHLSGGFTVSSHPTFFAYIPQTVARKVFFSLKNADGQPIYQATLPISGDASILRVDLPASAPDLEVNQTYQWGMALLCTGSLRPDSPFVSSSIQRIESAADRTSQLGAASAVQRAQIYGRDGIWYDMLTELVQMRQQEPNNTAWMANWVEVMNSVGLDAIASEPLVQPSPL